MFKIITKLFTSDKRFLIGLILISCLSSQGYSQVKGSADGEEVILPYTQEYLDQYNAALDKKAAQYNATFRSRSKAEAFNNSNKGNLVGACNLITCGSFEKSDVNGGTFRTAVGGTNGQYQADARYTCWQDDGTVDWSEGQYISYSQTNANSVYPGIIEPSTFDGGGFAIFSFQNEAIRQTLSVNPNTVYTVCFEIAVIPRYNTVNNNNQGGSIIEYDPNLDFGVRNGAVQISDPLTYDENDLVQHTNNDFPSRLSFATSGNGGNQNPGGWTEINPYWENRCITFRSGNNATSVEVFYKTGNPGRSVVLVDGLRLSVEGYANAPVLSLTEKTYCEPTQVQLDTFVTSPTPSGAILKWSANADLSNPLANNPTVTTPGVWYAFYLNSDPNVNCTSPSRKLTLTNTDLDSSYTQQNVTCFGGNNGSIDLSVTGGSSSYTYTWTTNDGSGLNPSSQDQSGLTAGTYNVTVNDGTCTTQETVVITQSAPVVVDDPDDVTACDSYTLPALTNGAYYGSPNGQDPIAVGTVINATQTIYVYAETGTTPNCSAENSFVVTINDTPLVDDPDDVTACDSYTLPALTNGAYYGSPNGQDPIAVGTVINATQTIYVYAETGTTPNCSAENSFVVTINDTPLVDDPDDVTACDSYTLPALTNGAYYGSPNGQDPIAVGTVINATQTIYVYAETGTTPNCSAENSFVVTINDTPLVDDPDDVTACDSYTLPALTNGAYYGSPNGQDPIAVGTVINATQTIYVYAETGTTPNCSAENSFVVTINDTPLVDDPDDVTACDSYTLPALTNGAYYGSPNGQDPIAVGTVINATQTIYVYAETGTTPNCSAENSFVVTINDTPLVDDPDDVTACDSYTLPALTNGAYYGSPNGQDPIAVGTVINATQTIYVYAETGTTPNCSAENSFVVTINDTPLVDDPDDVTACDSYTLPALTNGAYYGSPNGQDPIAVGTVINATQTIYVYAETGTTPNCSAENSFVVTINDTPLVDDPDDVTACDSYTLPALTNGAYYGSPNGQDPIAVGTVINATQTIYVYAETGTTPNCSAENSFVVTINDTPLVDDPDDVTACDSYTLPALTNGAYYGSPNGQDPIAVGTVINATQTIYVYAETGTTPNCSAENSFLVTINNCTIILEKIASPNNPQGCTPVAPGQSITYTFNVSNPVGNAPISNVELRDPLIDPTNNPLPGPVSGDTSNSGVLDAGETWVYTASYIVTQQDIINGQVQNTATINGQVLATIPYPVSDSDSVTVNLCQNAEISIVKSSVSATGDCINFEIDDTIDYKFVVTNEGDVDITNVIVNDTKLGGVIAGPAMGDINIDGILNVGEVWTYNASYTITQPDIDFGSVVNTATVDGDTALGHRDDTSNTVTVLICRTPNIALIKESTLPVDPTTGCSTVTAGQMISYTFKVKNTGNVTLTNVMVNDLVAGVTVVGGPIPSLAPGAEDTGTFTATYTVTQADIDAGMFSNSAQAVGTPPSGPDVTDISDDDSYTENDPTVITICTSASIALIKESTLPVDPTTGCSTVTAGQMISYTFKVKNTGNVTLTNVMVNDLVAGVTVVGGPIPSLAPGAEDTGTFTATYTVTQADIDAGMFSNSAQAVGTPPSGPDVTDISDDDSYTENDPTVITICTSASIALIKESTLPVDPTTGCSTVTAGQMISYTFKVKNTGNVTLTNVMVNDLVAGVTVVGGPIPSLAPGAEDTGTFTATYTVTQADIDAGMFSNSAQAVGTPPSGPDVTDISDDDSYTENDPTVITICTSASIALIKESTLPVDPTTGCSTVTAGQMISYTFKVKNTGNVTLTNVMVNDLVAGVTVVGGPIPSLAPGAEDTGTFTATYTVTQADIDAGMFSNSAQAVGTPPSGPDVTDISDDDSYTENDPTVITICSTPAIAIVKTGVFNDVDGNQCADAGIDTITYTFTVTNQGNVSLSDITVTDPLLQAPNPVVDIVFQGGDTDNDGELDVTETWIYTATSYTITQDDIDNGEVVNQATATGTAPDQSTCRVIFQGLRLAMTTLRLLSYVRTQLSQS